MHPARRAAVAFAVSCAVLTGGAASAAALRLELREGWTIQSSAKVTPGGEAVSRPGFATSGWHRATVPTTVVSALVAEGAFPDPGHHAFVMVHCSPMFPEKARHRHWWK